jgi:hypothetical protein
MHVCFGPTETYRNHTITYPLFSRQGVRNSTNSPEYKTEFFVVALSDQKNVEAVLCIRWLHYTSSRTDHPELIILPFDSVITVTDVVIQVIVII